MKRNENNVKLQDPEDRYADSVAEKFGEEVSRLLELMYAHNDTDITYINRFAQSWRITLLSGIQTDPDFGFVFNAGGNISHRLLVVKGETQLEIVK